LNIQYLRSERSVCIQRNVGIQQAVSDWVLLCDDDIEISADYLQKLALYITANPEAGAVSGLWLQKEGGKWKATYPENSAIQLLWKYVFKLGIWGEIDISSKNWIIKKIKLYYQKKGNHISKAGWPVVTDFSGDHFITPVYSLGASLVKKEWLLRSPFAEVLDPHGMGDNYGVAIDFPRGIHVLKHTVVYHHSDPINRLIKPIQYYRRVLALDYFIEAKKNLVGVKRIWLLWSLKGNLLSFILSGNRKMLRPSFKAIWKIATGQNPYLKAAKKRKRIIEPQL
jgi:glycosyltransferase involved in cell wall biosynthesis